MLKNRIITLALFSILVLSFFNFVVQPSYALSVTIVTGGTATDDNCIPITQDTHFNVWQVCAASTATTTQHVDVINPDTGATLNTVFTDSSAITQSATMQLLPVVTATANNFTVYKRGTGDFEKLNYDSNTDSVNSIGFYDPASCTTIGGRSAYDSLGNVWFGCTGADDRFKAFKPSSMIEVASSGVSDCDNPESVDFVYVNATDGWIVASCDVSDTIRSYHVGISSTPVPFTLTIATTHTGTISSTVTGGTTASAYTYVDTTVYQPSSTNHFARIFKTMGASTSANEYKLNAFTGAITLVTTGTGSATTQICFIRPFFNVFNDKEIFCIADDGTSQIQGWISNSTGLYNIINTVVSVSLTTSGRAKCSMNPLTDPDTVVCSRGGTNDGTQKIIRIDGLNELVSESPIPPSGGGSGGGGGPVGIDCTVAPYKDRAVCNGNPTNSFPSQLLNDTGTTLICQTGLLAFTIDANGNCVLNNPDMKTNGVGYLLTAVAIGIFVGILWVASRGQLTEIPTFIWFIGTLAILGAVTAFQWIDPTFLIVGIFAVIGLAVAKIKGLLGGQQLFAGET